MGVGSDVSCPVINFGGNVSHSYYIAKVPSVTLTSRSYAHATTRSALWLTQLQCHQISLTFRQYRPNRLRFHILCRCPIERSHHKNAISFFFCLREDHGEVCGGDPLGRGKKRVEVVPSFGRREATDGHPMTFKVEDEGSLIPSSMTRSDEHGVRSFGFQSERYSLWVIVICLHFLTSPSDKGKAPNLKGLCV